MVEAHTQALLHQHTRSTISIDAAAHERLAIAHTAHTHTHAHKHARTRTHTHARARTRTCISKHSACCRAHLAVGGAARGDLAVLLQAVHGGVGEVTGRHVPKELHRHTQLVPATPTRATTTSTHSARKFTPNPSPSPTCLVRRDTLCSYEAYGMRSKCKDKTHKRGNSEQPYTTKMHGHAWCTACLVHAWPHLTNKCAREHDQRTWLPTPWGGTWRLRCHRCWSSSHGPRRR
jgi:hypothetical protein